MFALLLIGTLLIIIVEAGGLIIVCLYVIIAFILFTGGVLLLLSTKPREYESAIWMTGIAFFSLLVSVKRIETFGMSFLNATSILTWTAIAFILLVIFGEYSSPKKYMYATIAFAYIVIRIFSH